MSTTTATATTLTEMEKVLRSMNVGYLFLDASISSNPARPGFGEKEHLVAEEPLLSSLPVHYRHILSPMFKVDNRFDVRGKMYSTQQEAMDDLKAEILNGVISSPNAIANEGELVLRSNLHALQLEVATARFSGDGIGRKALLATGDLYLTRMSEIDLGRHECDKPLMAVRHAMMSL
jgi:hypothetical protein